MTSTEHASFEVVLKGFCKDAQDPVAALARTFRIQHAAAAELLAQLPAVIQRRTPRTRAEYFRRALELIGAEVEVRDAEGRRVPAINEGTPAIGARPYGGLSRTGTDGPPARERPASSDVRRGHPGSDPAPSESGSRTAAIATVGAAKASPALTGSERTKSAPDDRGSGGWGRLMGLSTVKAPGTSRADDFAEPAAQGAFRPEPLHISGGNLVLNDNGAELELAIDPARARRRPPPADKPATAAAPRAHAPAPGADRTADRLSVAQLASAQPLSSNPQASAVREPTTKSPLAHRALSSALVAFTLATTTHGQSFGAWLVAGYASWLVLGAACWHLPGTLGLCGLAATAALTAALASFAQEFFEHVFWHRLRKRDVLRTGPAFSPSYSRETYLKRALYGAPWVWLTFLPILWWVMQVRTTQGTGDAAPSPTPLLAMLCLQLAYAPLALTTAASGRDSRHLWDVKRILRAATRAKARYALVCACGLGYVFLYSGFFTALRLFSHNPLLAALPLGLVVALGTAHCAVLMADLLTDYPHLLRSSRERVSQV